MGEAIRQAGRYIAAGFDDRYITEQTRIVPWLLQKYRKAIEIFYNGENTLTPQEVSRQVVLDEEQTRLAIIGAATKLYGAALKDPMLEARVLNAETLPAIIQELKTNGYDHVSVWDYDSRWCLFKHKRGTGEKLKFAYHSGASSGRPKLTGIYSVSDLEAMAQKK